MMSEFEEILDKYLDKIRVELEEDIGPSALLELGSCLTKAFIMKQNIAVQRAQQSHSHRPRIFDAGLKEEN